MATPPARSGQANRVVVAFLDGRRLRGYVYNFSPLKDHFRLFPADDPLHTEGTQVDLNDLKAVFFVREFLGDPNPQKIDPPTPAQPGRSITVTFKDGEQIRATTQGYDPKRLGFFIFPETRNRNNLRIFVVNRNIQNVKLG